MIKFDFSAMFAEWGTIFQRLPKGKGYYDYTNGGKWVPGLGQPEEISGIVVSLSPDELQMEPGGNYTRKDRKIYVQKPQTLNLDDQVIYKEKTYRIFEHRDYDEHADFNVYIGRRADTKGA
ncbi:hypothetical protein ACFCW7_23205 [Paenibacillus glucanolyticus]|uniref:hypothetical protein n=1 Tax=Paenibacillus glucanolyticus TaxID=59843 RepID=UPI0035DF3D4C